MGPGWWRRSSVRALPISRLLFRASASKRIGRRIPYGAKVAWKIVEDEIDRGIAILAELAQREDTG